MSPRDERRWSGREPTDMEDALPADAWPPPGHMARREARQRADTRIELVLLRHGEPDWAPGDGPSVADASLTDYGRAQAEAAAAGLARLGLDALYVSPLRRARETAEPVAKATGVTPEVVEGLAEIRLPLAGLSQSEVDSYFRQATRRRLHEFWNGWPGGESFREFHARVTGTLAALLARHDVRPDREDDFTVWSVPAQPQRIGIVAHGGTNAVAMTHLLDIAPVPWEWSRFEMELAAYAVLQSRAIGTCGFVWALQNFNEIDHLRAAGRR